MNQFLKRSLASSLVALSVSAFADPQPTTQIMSPIAVYLSAPAYKYDVSFTALVMKPMANNLDYAAEADPFNYTANDSALSPAWVIHEIPTEYHFGFDISAGMVFHGRNSVVFANWERYHSPTDSNSKTVPTADMIGPFFEIGPDAATYNISKGKVHFHFDEVNLDYGTYVNFGNSLNMNLFGGVGYASINEYRFTTFANDTGNPYRTITVPSKFWGVGPQLGLNFDYKMAKGFSFVGSTRASLFIGMLKNHTIYSTASTQLITVGKVSPNIQATHVNSKTGMVPGFEGKLGIGYDFTWGTCCNFKLEAGYQAQIYMNAIRSVDMGSEVAGGTFESIDTGYLGVYARTFERTVSDFALAGPYVKLDMGF